MALTRRTKVGLAGAAVVAVPVIAWLAFGYFGVHKLWVDDTVDEELTEFATTDTTDPDPDPDTTGASSTTTTTGESPTEASTVPAPPPEPEPVLVASGSFVGVEGHRVDGDVNLIRKPDGGHILQFPDLDAENGPDLVVWLSRGGSTDGVIDLGRLKGNLGNQEYEIPADVALEGYDTALIWCRRFSVGFGEATLG